MRPLLDSALERRGRCELWQPTLTRHHGEYHENRRRRCANAYNRAVHARLPRLLGLPAACIGRHLAAALML